MLRKIDNRIFELRNIRQEILQLLNGEKIGVEGEQPEALVRKERKLRAKSLKELRVAGIMDEFTLECFRPECQLTELTPDAWRQEMESADPELLFIESAWQGKDKLWQGKVNHCTSEVYELTEYCHEKNIPVIFWNKEDPVYTDVFMDTARRADVVFTTDIDCIEKYKTELGHDRVYHMHFAAQPIVHNPIEKYERQDKFCFAGAYYHRYQERCRVFDAFADYFIENRGFDIFDRNYQNARPEHKFPERYDPYILGRLEPSEIDIAYKKYLFGINMNSVTQSQTMFARRVFELMASNTIVVGNYSRGVKNYFGDLTFCTDDEKTLRKAFDRYCADRNSSDKLRLLALRKVLREHLCEDRMDYVVQKAMGCSLKRKLPEIMVCAWVVDQEQAQRVLKMFQTQSYENKHLLLIGNVSGIKGEQVSVIAPTDFDNLELKHGDFWTCFSPNDWYGENYLYDMALTTRYGSFDVIGKGEYFAAQEDGNPARMEEGVAYHCTVPLTLRRCMVSTVLLDGEKGYSLTADQIWNVENSIAIDAMNYCCNWTEEICPAAQDMIMADQGISLQRIEETVEKIPAQAGSQKCLKIDAAEIAGMKIGANDPVRVELHGERVLVDSELPAETHRYFMLSDRREIYDLLDDGQLNVIFRGEGSLHMMGCVFFYDENDKKIDAKTMRIGRRETMVPPQGAVYIRVAYRIREAGIGYLHNVEFGSLSSNTLRGNCFLSRSNVLVLTNHYPKPDDLYRNMFVHKRLMAYKEQGRVMDVMRMHPSAVDQVREFEGINIVEGHKDMLVCALQSGQFDTVCVHFLDENMWEVLKQYLESVRLIIWSHGADIQPWWRREFVFQTKEALEKGKQQSEKRMALWHEVMDAAAEEKNRIQLVFVSEYSRQIVEEDYARDLKGYSKIIPNLVDTSVFTYEKKMEEDRLKIVSIRPYASKIYANDLAVRAILSLSKRPYFKELEFTLIGRGDMFEETVKPLKKFKNVCLKETFLRQDEVVEYYHRNGIVLIPTRGDTQGVSRDEAMSCGLVPVTNAVAAIPEFVDHSCGILADAEDFQAIADGIEKLYYNPGLFLEMSENAAKRVRSQTSREYTIDREIELIQKAGSWL